jgi:hypothetical protein
LFRNDSFGSPIKITSTTANANLFQIEYWNGSTTFVGPLTSNCSANVNPPNDNTTGLPCTIDGSDTSCTGWSVSNVSGWSGCINYHSRSPTCGASGAVASLRGNLPVCSNTLAGAGVSHSTDTATVVCFQ